MIKKYYLSLLFILILNNCSDANLSKAKVVFVSLDHLNNASLQNININEVSMLADNDNKINSLKWKIIAIYLSQDMDENGTNIGTTSMVYLNPNCNNNISLCDISTPSLKNNPKKNTYNLVQDYFELARPSDIVNAEINAQYRTIKPGTYKYLRFEFCKYNDENHKTLSYAGILDGEAFGPIELQTGGCTSDILLLNPIEVEEGETITVNLNYTYENLFIHGDLNDTFDYSLGFLNDSQIIKNNKKGYLMLPDFSGSSVEK